MLRNFLFKQALTLLFVLIGLATEAQCNLSINAYSSNVAHSTQLSVSGTASSSYTWHFGDGSADSLTPVPFVSHQYADTGQYAVCVYGIDSNTFCRDTACQTLALSCNLSGSVGYQVDSVGNLTLKVVPSSADVLGFIYTVYYLNNIISYRDTTQSDSIKVHLTGGQYIAQIILVSIAGCVDTIVSDTFSVGGAASVCRMLQQGIPQGQDAYIRSDLPNINFGLSPDVLSEQWFYENSFTNSEVRGLIKFDLSSVPQGSAISSGILSLYADATTANSGNGYPGQPTYGGNNASILQRIAAPWNQLTVTWNNQPNVSNTGAIAVPQSSSTAQNYTLDITSLLNFWVQYPDSNFGVMLSMPNSSAFNNLVFCSSAHPDSALRPAVNFCYTPPANSCNTYFSYSNNGDSVLFFNQSGSVDSLKWHFDDGDSSLLSNPVHYFNSNGYHAVQLISTTNGISCSETEQVNVTGIVNDTLCGVVFYDVDRDNLYDNNDFPLTGAEVIIDGVTYLTDGAGFYHVPVGGGGHYIKIGPSIYTQQYPTAPENYAISTTNQDYICGLDFAMGNSNAAAIFNAGSTLNSGLSIYPNPLQGNTFTLKATGIQPGSPVTISVEDILGRTVTVESPESATGVFVVNIASSIGSGVYTVRCKTVSQQMAVRLVIAR